MQKITYDLLAQALNSQDILGHEEPLQLSPLVIIIPGE